MLVMFDKFFNFLLPDDHVSLTTTLSKGEVVDKLAITRQETQATGEGLIGSVQGNVLEIELTNWRRFLVPQVVFQSQIIEAPEGLRLEGRISFSLIQRGFVRVWAFVIFAMVGASLVLWVFSIVVDRGTLLSALLTLLSILLAFLVIVLIVAIYLRLAYAFLRSDRDALLGGIQTVLSAHLVFSSLAGRTTDKS